MKKILVGISVILLFASVSAFAGIATTIDPVRDTKVMLASFTTTTTVSTQPTFQVSTNAMTLTTAAATYTVTAGKTFNIQSITAACRGGGSSPQASTATLTILVNSVQQGQPYQVACPTTAAASSAAFPSLPVMIPNGINYQPGSVLSFTITVSTWSATNTPILDMSLYGYEF
jgi:hypothetical protein